MAAMKILTNLLIIIKFLIVIFWSILGSMHSSVFTKSRTNLWGLRQFLALGKRHLRGRASRTESRRHFSSCCRRRLESFNFTSKRWLRQCFGRRQFGQVAWQLNFILLQSSIFILHYWSWFIC